MKKPGSGRESLSPAFEVALEVARGVVAEVAGLDEIGFDEVRDAGQEGWLESGAPFGRRFDRERS